MIQFRYSSMPNYSCLKDVTIIVMQHAHPYIKRLKEILEVSSPSWGCQHPNNLNGFMQTSLKPFHIR